jgi:hypothetical protein
LTIQVKRGILEVYGANMKKEKKPTTMKENAGKVLIDMGLLWTAKEKVVKE